MSHPLLPCLPAGAVPRGPRPPGATSSVAAAGCLHPLQPQAPAPAGCPADHANRLAVHTVCWTQGRRGASREAGRQLEELQELQTTTTGSHAGPSCGWPSHMAAIGRTQGSSATASTCLQNESGPWPSGPSCRACAVLEALACYTTMYLQDGARARGCGQRAQHHSLAVTLSLPFPVLCPPLHGLYLWASTFHQHSLTLPTT